MTVKTARLNDVASTCPSVCPNSPRTINPMPISALTTREAISPINAVRITRTSPNSFRSAIIYLTNRFPFTRQAEQLGSLTTTHRSGCSSTTWS